MFSGSLTWYPRAARTLTVHSPPGAEKAQVRSKKGLPLLLRLLLLVLRLLLLPLLLLLLLLQLLLLLLLLLLPPAHPPLPHARPHGSAPRRLPAARNDPPIR